MSEGWSLERHASLRTLAMQARAVESVLFSLRNQRRALREGRIPEAALAALTSAIDELAPIRSKLMRELPKVASGTGLGDWVQETHGLGAGLLFLLGTLPALEEFHSVSAVWKYCGLHVVDGRAPRREAGGQAGFDPKRRAYAIMRVADPIVKSGGPYREVYDDRKEHTMDTHPPMLEEGEGCESCDRSYEESRRFRESKNFERERKAVAKDCSQLGGRHWTDGHRHADALRVTAKAVIRDAYRVAHGQHPRVGGFSEDA